MELPPLASYKPRGDGEPPLASAEDWVEFQCEESGRRLRRETLTMPQWAGSCWYYLRFADPDNGAALIGGPEEQYWLPVDLYVGGGEHATLHLLYARFWHKVLHDLGVVSTPEPFSKLVCQGMILGPTEHTGFQTAEGEWVSAEIAQAQEPEQRAALSRVVVAEEDVVKAGRGASGFALREASDVLLESAAHKMSKSRGNVVNPVRAKPNHHLIGLSTALTPNPLRETVLPTMPSAVHFPRIVCPLISCRHAAEHGDG